MMKYVKCEISFLVCPFARLQEENSCIHYTTGHTNFNKNNICNEAGDLDIFGFAFHDGSMGFNLPLDYHNDYKYKR
jgi:hypothetical protein